MSLAATIAPKLRLHIGTDQQTATIAELVTLAGSGFAVYGRMNAKKVGEPHGQVKHLYTTRKGPVEIRDLVTTSKP